MGPDCKIFQQQLQQWPAQQPLWLAFSGGRDSHALLHCVAKYHPQVQVIHINHGLQPTADVWAAHCRQICAELNVACQVVAGKVIPAAGESLEMAARKFRRKCWAEILPTGASLLLAHHLADQVETILYRLCRGCGPQALGGMQEKIAFARGWMWRPWLACQAATIAAYATREDLRFIEDPANVAPQFDRNFLRHTILPQLRTRWPAAESAIARSGMLAAMHARGWQTTVLAARRQIKGKPPNTLSIPGLLGLEPSLQYSVLQTWLQERGCYAVSLAHLQRVIKQVCQARRDRQPQFQVGGLQVRRYRDELYLLQPCPPAEQYEQLWSPTVTLLPLPGGRCLSRSDARLPLVVKLGKYCRRSKKIFQANAIPPWLRQGYPLVYHEGKLLGIAGLWWRGGAARGISLSTNPC